MARIAGASQYLNQATLTNLRGSAAQTTSVLGQAAGGVGVLDIGRNLASPGIGISNNARALNQQFLSQNAGTANQLFSASGGGSATVEAAQIQIRALQSATPVTRFTAEARETIAELNAVSERGNIVDESI